MRAAFPLAAFKLSPCEWNLSRIASYAFGIAHLPTNYTTELLDTPLLRFLHYRPRSCFVVSLDHGWSFLPARWATFWLGGGSSRATPTRRSTLPRRSTSHATHLHPLDLLELHHELGFLELDLQLDKLGGRTLQETHLPGRDDALLQPLSRGRAHVGEVHALPEGPGVHDVVPEHLEDE